MHSCLALYTKSHSNATVKKNHLAIYIECINSVWYNLHIHYNSSVHYEHYVHNYTVYNLQINCLLYPFFSSSQYSCWVIKARVDRQNLCLKAFNCSWWKLIIGTSTKWANQPFSLKPRQLIMHLSFLLTLYKGKVYHRLCTWMKCFKTMTIWSVHNTWVPVWLAILILWNLSLIYTHGESLCVQWWKCSVMLIKSLC